MKKTFLILFVLFFTTFCFAEEQAQKVEQMVMEFLENGSYIVIDEEFDNRFVNKTGIESLTVFSRYLKIRYIGDNSGSDAFVFTDYDISIDKKSNIKITLKK